jgi:hypothetical protein
MKSNSSKNPNKLWEKFKTFIMETDIRFLTFGPPIVIFLIMIALAFLLNKFLRIGEPGQFGFLIVGVSSIFIGLIGVIQIIRREVPGPFGNTIKGVYAVFSGIVFLLFFSIGGIFILISGIQSLSSK